MDDSHGVLVTLPTLLELSSAMLEAKGVEGDLEELVALLMSDPKISSSFQAHPMLKIILLEIARHEHVALKLVKVAKSLADLTKEDAKVLANNFQAELRICVALETGVEDWIQSSPALVSLDRFYLFFRPLLMTCLKPAVDARRVASGRGQQEGDALDPLTIMSYCRAGEMALESTPAGFLQLYKLSQSPKKLALGAVLSSCRRWAASPLLGLACRSTWILHRTNARRTPSFTASFGPTRRPER